MNQQIQFNFKSMDIDTKVLVLAASYLAKDRSTSNECSIQINEMLHKLHTAMEMCWLLQETEGTDPKLLDLCSQTATTIRTGLVDILRQCDHESAYKAIFHSGSTFNPTRLTQTEIFRTPTTSPRDAFDIFRDQPFVINPHTITS